MVFLTDRLSALALFAAILILTAVIVYLPYWTIMRLLKVSGTAYVKRRCKRHTSPKSRRTYHSSPQTARAPKPSPYDILQCKSDDNNETVKRNYRRLVRQYHPDHLGKLAGHEKKREEAKMKMQQINDAYEAVKKLRGLKK